MDKRVTSPTWGPSPPCKQPLVPPSRQICQTVVESLITYILFLTLFINKVYHHHNLNNFDNPKLIFFCLPVHQL